jgi:hypothetical protein
MGKRQRRRGREAGSPLTERSAATDYTDAEGNVLALRDKLPRGLECQLHSRPGGSADDEWQRREEILFERLAVSWTIAGLPITDQGELLGRYRIADSETRRWVRRTIDDHVNRIER